uniref:Chitin-binding type-2 domain-containing protein n=1 Tax=Ditylenchus dipsaci TaxID=166011 RepID=A0A915CU92_9BILA
MSSNKPLLLNAAPVKRKANFILKGRPASSAVHHPLSNTYLASEKKTGWQKWKGRLLLPLLLVAAFLLGFGVSDLRWLNNGSMGTMNEPRPSTSTMPSIVTASISSPYHSGAKKSRRHKSQLQPADAIQSPRELWTVNCQGMADGKHPMGECFSVYALCRNNTRINWVLPERCSSGQVFDNKKLECVAEDDYLRTGNEVASNPNELHSHQCVTLHQPHYTRTTGGSDIRYCGTIKPAQTINNSSLPGIIDGEVDEWRMASWSAAIVDIE